MAASGALAIGSMIVGSMMGNKGQAPTPAAPPTPPASQAAKTPDAAGMVNGQTGTGQSGGQPGVAQTFLTGTQGVNPNTLTLGKSSLLGS